MSPYLSRRRIVSALALLPAAGVFAACADPAETKTSASGKKGEPGAGTEQKFKVNTSPKQNRVRAKPVEEIAALVPERLRQKGVLTAGTSAGGAPPLTFYADDDKTVIGNEPDIAQLVADVLGLKLRLQTTSWENLFLSVKSGQYDVAFSNVTVTEERKDLYDFASYRVDEVAFETKADSTLKVNGPKDLAGLSVAVGSGTNQEQILLGWDKQNKAAGLKPIKFQYYQNAADYYLALRSGRIDVYLGPSPSVSYHVAVAGETKVVGSISGGGEIPADIAAMTKKGNGLVKALNAALNHVIEGGEYAKVLARWGLSSEAIPKSEVNPPGLPRQAK